MENIYRYNNRKNNEIRTKIKKEIIESKYIGGKIFIIEQVQANIYLAVNETLIKRKRLLCMRIQQKVLKEILAGYGD